MEITTKEFDQLELISIKGRVDSVSAGRLVQALEAAHQRGKYRLVIDMGQLEYMSSAGFRALATAQRNSMRHNRGEVVLTQVPDNVHEALETVGFTQHFKIIDPLAAALEYAGASSTAISNADVQPASPEP
jgi:anti-anti-sigma factor